MFSIVYILAYYDSYRSVVCSVLCTFCQPRLSKVVNKEIGGCGSEPKYQNASRYPTTVEYKVSFKIPSKYQGDEDKI